MKNNREIQDWLIAHIANRLDIDPDSIDIRESFSAYGLSSLDIVTLSGELEDFLNRRLPPTLAYDYPDILSLSNYLAGHTNDIKTGSGTIPPAAPSPEPIAVIGMSCRFPGAKDPAAFWQLLRDGVDAVSEIPEDRWDKKAFYHPDPLVPGKSISCWGGFLTGIDQFDPFFFGISPVEAKYMDPQQRLLLELSCEALDDAGQVVEELNGSKTGVFIGISVNEYSLLQFGNPAGISAHSGTGNALSIAANRISYTYNFHGPSIAIDTACSSSLAAVHLACQSLRNGECTMALSGGVNLILSPAHSVAFTKAGVLAPDGRCKSFDAHANGYVRGEGGGIVVLKTLSAAIADGDPIYGMILGSAMIQDGRTNGLIAPSSEAQERLLRETYRAAGVSPGSVQYIEAHGTGTLLGDAMEAKALGAVIGSSRTDGSCIIGSVKTNIGHLEAAAGIAGLIKVMLGFKHRAIPPTIHYQLPNPNISFSELNLQVKNELIPWPSASGPSLAGVSSFGFGGTNVHLVVRDADKVVPELNAQPLSSDTGCHLLPLSGQSRESLQLLAESFGELLSPDSPAKIKDICYAAAARRSSHDYRLAIMGSSQKELCDNLQAFLHGEQAANLFTDPGARGRQRRLAFVFSGQGGQWYGMGRELIKKEPVFRQAIEAIGRLIHAGFGWSLMEVLEDEGPASRTGEIDVVQPAIFAIQVGLARQWQSWGIHPDAVTGHSMGEIAAAHVAGILSLEDAVTIVCYRSQLLKRLKGQGSMLATALSQDEAGELLKGFDNDVSVAAINGPASTVLSGSPETIKKIMDFLEGQNAFCRLVNVDVASHSPQMDGLGPELHKGLGNLTPRSPAIPVYSTVKGDREEDLVFDAGYWMDNIRKPVLFSGAIQKLLENGYSTFVEIGPHPVLLGSIQQSLRPGQEEISLLPSLRRDEPERETMLRALGQLYVQGFSIAWSNLYPVKGKHVQLPPVPWERQRYWMDAPSAGLINSPLSSPEVHSLTGKRMNLAHSPGSFVWQTILDDAVLPFLADHRVAGEVLFPAAAYIEMALQCAKESGLHHSYTLCNLVLKESMALHGGKPKTIQSLLSPGEKDGFIFSIYSQAAEEENWMLHASGSFVKSAVTGDLGAAAGFRHDVIRQQSTSQYTAEEFYKILQSHHLHYGPAFRGVRHIWASGSESLGYIELPAALQHDSNVYQLHPALLDACLQVLAATQIPLSGQYLYLPAGCKQIRFFSRPGQQIWSHVSVPPGPAAGTDILTADIRLYDNDGKAIAELTGFQLQRTSRQLRSLFSQQDTWLYHLHWQATGEPESVPAAGMQGRHWLILADDEGLGEELAAQIESNGGRCRLLLCREAVEKINSAGDEFFAGLTGDISGGAPWYGIIHLWSLSTPPPFSHVTVDWDAMQVYGCKSVLYLVQALAKRMAGLPRLWIVTRGAQSVTPGESIAVEQSAVWGLGKVISFELPELKCSRIDLDPLQPVSESVSLLIREISTDDREDQVAFRGGLRFIHRLLPLTGQRSLASPAVRTFSPGGTYVVTGGLGSIGLLTAEWMSKQGARHIVLMGRNKPSLAASDRIEQMRKEGTEVAVANADVSDLVQLQQVIDRIKKDMPALRGIIHAAGLLDDGSLLNLSPERMKKVMAPKLDGTWNLHVATMGLSLDFFVLFSSAVSVLGSPGQGNYAAASACLDAFAYFLRGRGVPAVSINWGPWAEVGLAAEAAEKLKGQNASTEHLIKAIKADRGLEILEQLLTMPEPQVLVLPFDLKSLIELYPTAAGLPFLEKVGGSQAHVARLYARPKLRQPYVAPRNEIEHKLAQLWQQTLHIDRVGVHDSFFELGGDSVLAAQVLALAQKAFGIQINLQDAFKAFTIEKLAAMLEEQIVGRIEEMSEEEAIRLLSIGN